MPVVAQHFLDPQFRPPFPVILGLHGGAFHGRTLRRELVLGNTPTGNPTPDRADAGARFGRQWHPDGDGPVSVGTTASASVRTFA